MEILDILLSENFWAAALRIATPLIFGVLGALICEKSGVLNLGIEGIFAAGAMAGWMAVWLGADLWSGLFFAAFDRCFFWPYPCYFNGAIGSITARFRLGYHHVCHFCKLFYLSNRPS